MSKELENILLSNVDKITSQSLKNLDLVEATENQRLLVNRIKNEHLDTVLNAQDNGKPRYTNDKQRQIALDKLLTEDIQYNEANTILENMERQLKIAQIELEHLHNLFRANLAITAVQSIK